ncbi:MAG: sulfite exporter TauE/SafE family protein [Verrucomicrobiales bacterium]|nr:sulfite exporter TauE/SafE family protein [Verrucomicrobiales bacterium]
MHLWTAWLLGMLGGLHCAGMCGPLMLALPRSGGSTVTFAAGRLAYQAGRVVTYGMIGVLAGTAGRGLAMAGWQRGVSVTLGVLMVASLFVSPRALTGFAWPSMVVGRLKMSMAGLLRRRGLMSLTVLGALNGLLPCGLVYAAGAGAATLDSAWEGALYMIVFGLGTLPMMLGISLCGQLVPTSVRLRLRHLVPVSVGLVGCLLILRGLSLGIPYLSPDLSGGGAACHVEVGSTQLR